MSLLFQGLPRILGNLGSCVIFVLLPYGKNMPKPLKTEAAKQFVDKCREEQTAVTVFLATAEPLKIVHSVESKKQTQG